MPLEELLRSIPAPTPCASHCDWLPKVLRYSCIGRVLQSWAQTFRVIAILVVMISGVLSTITLVGQHLAIASVPVTSSLLIGGGLTMIWHWQTKPRLTAL